MSCLQEPIVPLSPAHLKFLYLLANMMVTQGSFPRLIPETSLALCLSFFLRGSFCLSPFSPSFPPPTGKKETSLHGRGFRKSNELSGEAVDGPKHLTNSSYHQGISRGRLDKFNSELLGILTERMGLVPECPDKQDPRSASREASIGSLSSSELPLLGRLLESRTAPAFGECGSLT